MNQLLQSSHFSTNVGKVPDSGEGKRESRIAPAASAEPIVRLLARRDDRLVVVHVDAVDWIESAGNDVRLHVGQIAYMLRQTLGGLALHLDARRFARIHRTAIVNLDSIAEIVRASATEMSLLLNDGRELAVSRRYRRQLFACLGTP